MLDDPFGRTDYTGIRLCFEGLFPLSLEQLSPQEQAEMERRYERQASNEFNKSLHRMIIGAANALIEAYSFAWTAWRLPALQFSDLTGYSAFHRIGGRVPGKLIRSLQPDPDKRVLDSVKDALMSEDKPRRLRQFLEASSEVKRFWHLEMAAARALFRRDTLAAVIICITGVEVYVNSVLREWVGKHNVRVTELKQVLAVKDLRALTVWEVIERAKLGTRLKSGIRKACGINLAQRTFWPQWRDAVEMRNRAAHLGVPPSIDGVAKGLIAAHRIFELIEGSRTNATRGPVPE